MIVEEGEVGEIHHQTETFGTADADKGSVLHRVFTKGNFYPMVYITSIHQTGFAAAMAVFIQRQDNCAPLCQFDGVGGAGFVVILIAVEQQYTGGRCLGCGRIRHVELVGQASCIGFQRSFGNRNAAAVCLDPAGNSHEKKNRCQQTCQKYQSLTLFGFHKNTSRIGIFNVSIAQ